MLRALADIASRRTRTVLGLTGLLFVLAVGVGGPVAGLLDTGGNPFTDPESETEQVRERLKTAAGEQAGVGLVALVDTPTGTDSPLARERVESVAATLREDPAVARVLAGGPAQVSSDGRSAYVAVVFRDVDGGEIDETVERIEADLGDQPAVKLGGGALAGPAVGDQVGEDIGRAELLAFPIIFLLSFVFFRGFVARRLHGRVGLTDSARD